MADLWSLITPAWAQPQWQWDRRQVVDDLLVHVRVAQENKSASLRQGSVPRDPVLKGAHRGQRMFSSWDADGSWM